MEFRDLDPATAAPGRTVFVAFPERMSTRQRDALASYLEEMRGVLASSGSLETVLSDAITTAPGTDDADAQPGARMVHRVAHGADAIADLG